MPPYIHVHVCSPYYANIEYWVVPADQGCYAAQHVYSLVLSTTVEGVLLGLEVVGDTDDVFDQVAIGGLVGGHGGCY